MDLREALFQTMYRIRRVEEEVARIYPTDKIKSPVHLAIGQEAVAAGVCFALRPDDVLFGTYRSHAIYLAKGGDLRAMVAELYGKVTGCARGKGGSMHLIDVRHGFLGTSAVVATTIPHAVGYAWALRQQRKGSIVVSFFGDGAVEEGVFYESLNVAKLKDAPVLFVCENNGLAIHSRLGARQAMDNIAARAMTYGIPSLRIEGNDVLAIHAAAKDAVDAIRGGSNGPRFLECVTYRWKEHVGPGDDFSLGYRTPAELQPWIDNDEIERLARLLDPTLVATIRDNVDREVDDAFAFAEASPFPEPEELFADVVKEEVGAWSVR